MEDGGFIRWQLRMITWTGSFVWKKISMKQSVHPHFSLYKRLQDWSIYLIFTTVFTWLTYSCFCFHIEKRRYGRDLWRCKWRWSWGKHSRETILTWKISMKKGTQLIVATVKHDCMIPIIVVSIVFPACHVFKSHIVVLFSFFRWGRRGRRRDVRCKCLGVWFCVLY